MATEIIPTPRKARTRERADKSKHRQYHRNSSHHIEECITLKEQIEKLVQVGQLKRFVRDWGVAKRGRSPEHREKRYGNKREERFRRRDERRVERIEERNNQSPQSRRSRERSLGRPVRGFINTIYRGFAGGEYHHLLGRNI